MGSSPSKRQKRILIVDPDSLFGAGLMHLLTSGAEVHKYIFVQVASDDSVELARTLESFRPHLVIVTDLGFRLSPEIQHVLDGSSPAPRIIRIGPDCNEACVHDLSRVSLTEIGDLLALIPNE